MRVVVTGGRDFMDKVRVHVVLSKLHSTRGPITYLVEGGQRRTDWWAALWRKEKEISAFKADLARHGNAAGPIRNGQMIEEGEPGTATLFLGGKEMKNNMLLQARTVYLEVMQG